MTVNIQDLEKLISLMKMMEGGETSSPSNPDANPSMLIGEKVIVRCRDAGVHFGELVSRTGRDVTLKDARRMYYWKAAKGHTLSGCAIHGIASDSKIAGNIEIIELPEACEIIKCADSAAKSIGDANEYNN